MISNRLALCPRPRDHTKKEAFPSACEPCGQILDKCKFYLRAELVWQSCHTMNNHAPFTFVSTHFSQCPACGSFSSVLCCGIVILDIMKIWEYKLISFKNLSTLTLSLCSSRHFHVARGQAWLGNPKAATIWFLRLSKGLRLGKRTRWFYEWFLSIFHHVC